MTWVVNSSQPTKYVFCRFRVLVKPKQSANPMVYKIVMTRHRLATDFSASYVHDQLDVIIVKVHS
jgi:hypothetical protein